MTYKIFEAGETLSANDVMTYFMNQIVSREALIADLADLPNDIKTAWVSEDDSLYIRSTSNAWVRVPKTEDIESTINTLLNGADDALDTLAEIADALEAAQGQLYALPVQTGNAGKFLSTDGTTDSWAEVSGFASPTIGSTSITSGATVTTIADLNTDYPTLKAPTETVNIVSSGASGTVNIDIATSTVWYYTSNASANHTLNFRFSSSTSLASKLSVGESVSVVWLSTNGSTAYYPTAFQIDGTSQTVKWSGGTAPSTGNASAIDAYSFTIIKTAETPSYLVIGGQVKLA